MIQAVYFDLDNTLYNYDKAERDARTALEDCARQIPGLSMSVFRDSLKQSQDLITEHLGKNDSAIHNRLIRFQYMLELTMQNGVKYPDGYLAAALKMYHAYWDAFLENAEPEEGARDFLSALHENGIMIGIATNMTAYMQLKKLERLGLTRYIDRLVSSEEAGAEKPSASFFHYCIDKAGCPPEKILFIGDSMKHDVLGAVSCKMHAAWYHPGDSRQDVRVSLKENADESLLPQDSPAENPPEITVPLLSSWQDCLNGTQIKWEKLCRI